MHPFVHQIIDPRLLLSAYRGGIFPMADSRNDREVFWIEPRERAIIPLDGFRLSRSLAKVLRQERFEVTCNRDFTAIIEACAEPRPDACDTWISRRIQASYAVLHEKGHAHSIECWCGGRLVGGLYGVAFDRVFCGESMFSRVPDASKVALAWLVAMMRRAGYQVLDCQFMTAHLASLGAIALSRAEYLIRLGEASAAPPRCSLPEAYVALVSEAASAGATGCSSSGKLIAQSLTHTS